MTFAYLRVSTEEQEFERQIFAIHQAGYHPDRIYKEKASGASLERSQLRELLIQLKKGDLIIVENLTRLTRRTEDLFEILKLLDEKGAKLKSVTQDFDFSTSTGKLILTLLGSLAQFERDCILERQRYGIEKAKREGKYKGRKPIKYPSNFEECYHRYMTCPITDRYTLKEFASDTGLKFSTFQKFYKERRKKG